ncbi:TRAP transporter large permease [Tropicibacter naphthalenivorans]|uniref:Neu5Ac permease n=1 Tax=Tropicibacter naphthalenivorans TaxID=441103 RepID=A0A0P1GJ44_9RHOB|nr:TRAP transporter large permease subunit [Tropicibacter naphthalenivorans]CUH76008.1 Neu5Ac permease [Tropicibacter naphthalenivorans]SMC40585.1 TRAP transporter, DctM subunit [Tropicibacter naphthalenivorans]
MVDIGTLSLILLLAMFALLAIGMPLGFASAFLAVVTLVLKFDVDILFRTFGQGPFSVLGQAVYRQMTNYVLISVPLFIFMAALLERSGIARDMYSSLNVWLSRTRGGIAIVTSVMAVIMAAMSGIIGGEVVLLGLIALPQMLRLGYNQNLAIGTICASGSLGTMIPPSIVLIFYGLVTETSIKALFTASFLPGFMLAMFFIIYIIVVTQLDPSKAPLPPEDPTQPKGGEKGKMFLAFVAKFVFLGALWFIGLLLLISLFSGGKMSDDGVRTVWEANLGTIIKLAIAGALGFGATLLLGRERTKAGWDMGKGLIAPIVVVGVVLGSIYGGITGITEAAAMGVIAVFVISVVRREMTFEIVWDSLMRTLKSTGTIIWVTIGAAALAAAYTLAGGPTYVANLIVGADMPTMGVILLMMLIFLIMGMFMDWVGIVLLIMPVFLPIVTRLPAEEIGWLGSIDARYIPIWFGVVFCMNMQVSFLSPPFGPAAFYLKSVAPAHISLTDIFRGFLPFIALQLLALLVLLAWPPIITIFLD